MTFAQHGHPKEYAASEMMMNDMCQLIASKLKPAHDLEALTKKFLQWPVPASVCPDGTPGQPGRTGTNLLSYDEARQMLGYLLEV
jgi:hypothetical protein